MNILGIGGIRTDSAAALLCDGRLVAAAEESKIARRRRVTDLPVESIDVCLNIGKLSDADIDLVAVARPLACRRRE